MEDCCSSQMTLLPGLKGNGIFFRYLNYVGLTHSFKLSYSFTKTNKQTKNSKDILGS